MNTKEEKRTLRKTVLAQLVNQNLKERNAKSKIVQEKIVCGRDFKSARQIMFYAAMRYEVDTADIIMHAFRMGKKVILPLLNKEKRVIIPCEIKDYEKDTEWCRYEFREPNPRLEGNIDVKDIDLVIVPGICFDQLNNRLGRGVGYYDKFLANVKPAITTIGLAFDFQVYAKIPTEKHDIPVSKVFSNN